MAEPVTALERVLDASQSKLWILWGASAALAAVFGGLSFVATQGVEALEPANGFKIGIGVSTTFAAALAIATPRLMLPKRKIVEHMRAKTPPVTGAIGANLQELSQLSPRDARLASLVRVYEKPFYFGIGVAALIDLIGFMYVTACGEALPFALFAGVGLVVRLINRPAAHGLVKRARKLVPEPRPPAPTALPMTRTSQY